MATMFEPFRFKQFSISHQNAAMKVGTDGVLLGAWCTVDQVQNVLDVGTGSGLLALMIAQRNVVCQITALEVDTEAAKEAEKNFKESPFFERVMLSIGAFQASSFDDGFDLIVCNPPFFNSGPAAVGSRGDARHETRLSVMDLMKFSVSKLNSGGVLAVIVPTDRVEDYIDEAAAHKLHLSRACAVRPTPSQHPKRMLMEFTAESMKDIKPTELIIEEGGRHQYSEAYKSLTAEFYLAF